MNHLLLNKDVFLGWIKHPAKLNREEVLSLVHLAEKYPYSSVIQLLLGKCLHAIESIHLDEKLPLLSLNSYDQSHLIRFLHAKTAEEQVVLKEEREVLLEQKTDPLALEFLEQQYIKESIASNYLEFVKKEPLEEEKKKIEPVEPVNEDVELPGSSDKKSFSAWLEDLSTGTLKPKNVSKKEQQLINSFVTFSKEKQKKEFFSPSQMAKKSIQDNEEWVTETLVDILVKQQNYDKAIKGYEKLSLLFPEKKAYFASKIESLKKIKS